MISTGRWDSISLKSPTAQMLHVGMGCVKEVSSGIALCLHLLVLLISSMLSTLVPFFLKMETINESVSQKDLFTILNLLLSIEVKFGDFHSFGVQYTILFICSEVVCKRCNGFQARSALMKNFMISILRFE